ncbi:MAG: pentapeptide repeat-containing protein [Oscillatoriales cyanobacterium RM2_1_1]|nr:pentapeptide repeat-containing protein [Oscillatoriales cyanobacterium SM2_3_0]NJO46654.1 pentapeptide repeat-containing protein [Oscillatoriales cyanobacterium RM2_1_1]
MNSKTLYLLKVIVQNPLKEYGPLLTQKPLPQGITQWFNQRQRSRFWRMAVRLLQDVIEVLIILATVIIVILTILYAEDFLKSQTTWGNSFIKSIEKSRILGTFESISIVTALVVYVRRGKKQSQYEAWQVIDSMQGTEISHARIKALEDLAKDGVSFKGLSLPRANLEQITLVDVDFTEANLAEVKLQEANLQGCRFELTQLQGANLGQANLRESFFLLAQLQQANLGAADLRNADLQGVNLLEANLQKANLQGAYILGNLQAVNFQEANLRGATLAGAYLKNASFQNTNLRGANLKEANLEGVNFQGANLNGVNFQQAKGLNPKQIQQAKSWQQALYSKEFSSQLGLL